MKKFIFRRIITTILAMFFASMVVFFSLEVLPADAAQMRLGIQATPELLANLRHEMGLDRPLYLRYFSWIGAILQGDFGMSSAYNIPVSQLLIERLAVSLPLALYALFLAIAFGGCFGFLAAFFEGRLLDRLIMGATQIGIALPNFWLGILLIQIFALGLGWFASGGFVGWGAGFGAGLWSLTLPAITLAAPQAAIIARIFRTGLVDNLSQNYILIARAKGRSRFETLSVHAAPNALSNLLTIIGLQFSFLIAGAIIIENVFYLPGLGRLAFQAIGQRDLIVVEAVVLVMVFIVFLVSFFTDMAYAWIDPRVKERI